MTPGIHVHSVGSCRWCARCRTTCFERAPCGCCIGTPYAVSPGRVARILREARYSTTGVLPDKFGRAQNRIPLRLGRFPHGPKGQKLDAARRAWMERVTGALRFGPYDIPLLPAAIAVASVESVTPTAALDRSA